jgi:dehydrogenase/reductase SDR family protein 7B
MEVNFFGVVRLTNLILSYMIKDNNRNSNLKLKKRSYSIVNIGSVQSYLGIPYRAAYCSSKHALLAYSDSLRAELYKHENIDIINCQPGYINTNIAINALTSEGIAQNTNDDDHRKGFDPNDVAQIVIDSILNRDKEVLIAIFLHRIAIWARFFIPNIFSAIMSKRAKGDNSIKKLQ